MLALRRCGGALVVMGVAALLVPACAATVAPESGAASDDDSGEGGGGAGGAAEPPPNPCGIDCSDIVTPSCYRSKCDKMTEQCVVVPDDGADCDDGVFCTVGDSCLAGACVGGLPNACGQTASACHEIVCDESSQQCVEAELPNDTPCQAATLCTVNSKCQMGVCVGAPKDCTFAPKPDPAECHTATCNPQTGDCEAEPANDGGECVDPNDLCSVGKLCDAGACVGGTGKDCSSLTVGCFNGVCNANNGDCEQEAVGQGGSCAEGDGQCTVGICDDNGTCVAEPAYEGNMCNDLDFCSSGEVCDNAGACSGGQPVVLCMDGDNCCPAACDETNDVDCACGIDDLRISELHIGGEDYAALTNPSACDLSLAGLQVFFDDSTLADLVTVLPNQVLAAGESVYIVEAGAMGDDIDAAGNITFSYTRGGAMLLCLGACDPADGSNVIDLVAFSLGETHPTLPAGVTFQNAGLGGIDNANDDTDSFIHGTYFGQAPDFLASDWKIDVATH